jgi:hypothetical protein
MKGKKGRGFDSYLGMWENGGDVETSGAFYVHEKAVGSLNQSLQLVLASLITLWWE